MPAFSSDSRTTLLGRLDLDHNFGAMRIWVYRDWLATVPLSVIAFAVVCAALVWASTSKVGAWLASGQPLVLAVIGAVWWAFLSPRVIGIATRRCGVDLVHEETADCRTRPPRPAAQHAPPAGIVPATLVVRPPWNAMFVLRALRTKSHIVAVSSDRAVH